MCSKKNKTCHETRKTGAEQMGSRKIAKIEDKSESETASKVQESGT